MKDQHGPFFPEKGRSQLMLFRMNVSPRIKALGILGWTIALGLITYEAHFHFGNRVVGFAGCVATVMAFYASMFFLFQTHSAFYLTGSVVANLIHEERKRVLTKV